MLLNGGTLNGARLLSRKSVELMTSDATPGLDLRNYMNGEQPLQGYGFGLGVRVRRNNGENRRLRVGRRAGHVLLDRSKGGADRHRLDADQSHTPENRVSRRRVPSDC